MVDIELVIKIPKEVYERILKAKSVPDVLGIDIVNTINATKNGTPLDKHDEEIIAETVESIWGKPPYTELLDRLTADLESLREPTEPHLVDYRYHRNDMLDMVLGVIERYRNEVSR